MGRPSRRAAESGTAGKGECTMKRIAWLAVAVLAAALVFLAPASASAFVQRSGNVVTVAEPVHDDLYVFGSDVEVTGDVDGDVVAFGQNIVISGDVAGGVITAGQSVRVTGSVGGSVRAAGSDISIEGKVAGDVLAAGNAVRISSAGTVGRDALLGGAQVSVDGTVGRNVLASAGQVTISAPVGGDVTADVSRLTIASGASVAGGVTYYSDATASINGSVAGPTRHFPPRNERQRTTQLDTTGVVLLALLAWARGLVGMALFALIVVLGARRVVERAAEEGCRKRPWPSLGIGAGILAVAFPVAGLVFLIGLLIGGWWISFAWMAVVWLLAAAGLVVGALAVGGWLLRRMGASVVRPLPAALLGLLAVWIVAAVPFVGWLGGLAAMMLGMGALVLAAYARQGALPEA